VKNNKQEKAKKKQKSKEQEFMALCSYVQYYYINISLLR